jgi:membrane protein DedA with SNARE-associated domain
MEGQIPELILQYKYLILVLLGVVEGPIVSVIAGFFFRLDYLSFIPAYAALMLGDLIGDVGWYGIGYYFGNPFIKRFGKYFSVTEEGVGQVERLFHQHKDWILIVSKITMGFGFAIVTLIAAGLVKIPFRRYMLLNVTGQFIWTGFLLGIGYFVGHVYETVGGIFSKISIAAVLLLAGLLIAGASRYVKARVIQKKI